MEFGIPSKQRVKTEKYPETPVLTLHPHAGAKTSRKIEFNTKAYETLGLKEDDLNYVAFSFDANDPTMNMIINANEFKMDAKLKIAKNGVLSNKAHYNEIKSRFGAKDDDTLELTLIDTGREYKDHKLYRLATVESMEMAEEGEDVTDLLYKGSANAEAKADDAEASANASQEVVAEEAVEAPAKGMSIGAPQKDPTETSDMMDDEEDASETKQEIASDRKVDAEDDDDLPF